MPDRPGDNADIYVIGVDGGAPMRGRGSSVVSRHRPADRVSWLSWLGCTATLPYGHFRRCVSGCRTSTRTFRPKGAVNGSQRRLNEAAVAADAVACYYLSGQL